MIGMRQYGTSETMGGISHCYVTPKERRLVEGSMIRRRSCITSSKLIPYTILARPIEYVLHLRGRHVFFVDFHRVL